MTSRSLLAAVATAALAGPAFAGTLAFSGTFNNTNPPAAPGGRCPVLTVNIGPTAPFSDAGMSNFGDFTSVQSHCLANGPPIAPGAAAVPYTDGLFTYTFSSGATLSGTYTGVLTNGGAFGVIDNVQHFLITGGTGRFAMATGSFLGTGGIRFAGGPPAATLAISSGTITVPGVPEPATWILLLTGFGAAGIALRRRPVVVAA